MKLEYFEYLNTFQYIFLADECGFYNVWKTGLNMPTHLALSLTHMNKNVTG